jgi:hypothetical protein
MIARGLGVSPVTSVTRGSQNVISGAKQFIAADLKATINNKGETLYDNFCIGSAVPGVLFVAQGFDGIELGGAKCRNQAAEHANQEKHQG